MTPAPTADATETLTAALEDLAATPTRIAGVRQLRGAVPNGLREPDTRVVGTVNWESSSADLKIVDGTDTANAVRRIAIGADLYTLVSAADTWFRSSAPPATGGLAFGDVAAGKPTIEDLLDPKFGITQGSTSFMSARVPDVTKALQRSWIGPDSQQELAEWVSGATATASFTLTDGRVSQYVEQLRLVNPVGGPGLRITTTIRYLPAGPGEITAPPADLVVDAPGE